MFSNSLTDYHVAYNYCCIVHKYVDNKIVNNYILNKYVIRNVAIFLV